LGEDWRRRKLNFGREFGFGKLFIEPQMVLDLIT
jgi:hypothetical protein